MGANLGCIYAYAEVERANDIKLHILLLNTRLTTYHEHVSLITENLNTNYEHQFYIQKFVIQFEIPTVSKW